MGIEVNKVQLVMSKWHGLLSLLLCLSACDGGSGGSHGPQYGELPQASRAGHFTLAVHLGYNPQRLLKAYQPLVDYLNRNIHGVEFELEASRDFPAFEDKFRSRNPAFLLPNPWQSLEAMKSGYRVIAMAGDKEDFRGIFLVRKESAIRRPADIRGKRISYPAPTALAACIMPQYYLYRHGIDVMRDVENLYVGSQESSITNVLLHQADVGVTWPPPWRAFQKDFPQQAAQLKVIWETPFLINNPFMVRKDVPERISVRVSELLLALHESDEGRRILEGMETSRFHAASDASYEPVREFIRRFEKEVRPVEVK